MAEKYISEVTIVLDKSCQDQPKTNEAIEKLKALGMSVTNVDEDDSVVEGDIDSSKLGELEKLECVDYVRTVFSYIAED
jgi:ribosomal protein L4